MFVCFLLKKKANFCQVSFFFFTKTLNENKTSQGIPFLTKSLLKMHRHASSLMISRSPVATTRGRSGRCRASSSSSPSKNAPKAPSSSQQQRLKNRRDVFISGTAFSALFLLSSSSSFQSAHAYGTGGWKDCEPVCDSLKGGFAAQQKLQEEMMRQATMGGGSGGESGDDVTSSGEQKKGVSEREKRKKNLR